MRSFKKIFLILLALIGLQSHAGFLVDPYLGFNIASFGTNDATVPSKYSYSGVNMGGRAGYQLLGFMAGAEYSMRTSFSMETEAPLSKSTQDFTGNYLGVFVGYELPILLRGWAGYYLDVNFNNAGPSTNTLTQLDGSGIFLGAGFTGLPFISINAEYRNVIFSKATVSNVTGDLVNKITTHEILLTVSLPLDL